MQARTRQSASTVGRAALDTTFGLLWRIARERVPIIGTCDGSRWSVPEARRKRRPERANLPGGLEIGRSCNPPPLICEIGEICGFNFGIQVFLWMQRRLTSVEKFQTCARFM